MCPHCFPPRDAMTGHKKAQHMARYSHKPWIAWQDTAGQMQAAQATPENLERAIADIGETGKISGYFGERHGHLARKAMAEVWLSNARIGMLLC
jgi:hypothetical protein